MSGTWIAPTEAQLATGRAAIAEAERRAAAAQHAPKVLTEPTEAELRKAAEARAFVFYSVEDAATPGRMAQLAREARETGRLFAPAPQQSTLDAAMQRLADDKRPTVPRGDHAAILKNLDAIASGKMVVVSE